MGHTPSSPIITLLTDFGENDFFVGSIKGVILSINSDVTIVDITHNAASFSIAEAAFLLHSSYAFFPEGTIHVAVVDPGVGSSRRPLVVYGKGVYFLAPDNGLLSYIFRDTPDCQIFELTETAFHRSTSGTTFDARDIFASVAGWMSRGIPTEELGKKIIDPVTLPLSFPKKLRDSVEGEVIYIDKFGNIITNITLDDLVSFASYPRLMVTIGNEDIQGITRCYKDASEGIPSVLINSSGYLEVFVFCGNASAQLSVFIKDSILVQE